MTDDMPIEIWIERDNHVDMNIVYEQEYDNCTKYVRADIAQGEVADVIFNNIYAKFLEIINSCGDPFKRSAYRDMAPLLKKAIAAAINNKGE